MCVHCVHNINLVTQTQKMYNGEMLNKNSKSLTSKQKRVLEYISSFLDENKVSPTILQLAKFLGVSSLRTVTQYLESLEKKGFIVRSHHQARGIRLVTNNDTALET